jgi:hypothetical protein
VQELAKSIIPAKKIRVCFIEPRFMSYA